MSERKKIFVLVPPVYGHINPISGIVSELVKKDMTVVFYGNEHNRPIIDQTGAQFRLYSHASFDYLDVKQIDKTNPNKFTTFLNKLLDFSYSLLPDLLKDVERDQPDLLIYDQIFLPAKYLVEILNKRPATGAPIKTVMFMPSFAMNDEIVQTVPDFSDRSFGTVLSMLGLFFRQLVFNFYYGLRVMHPLQVFSKTDAKLNIVAVFPELQPLKYMFNEDNFKFVGPCISEKVRQVDVADPKLRQILDEFKTKHSDDDRPNDENHWLKLVYVSMGTVFNKNNILYDKIIEAFRLLDRKDAKIRLNQLKVVFSMGKSSHDDFERKIRDERYELPSNIMLFPQVPQIEILKRASLFITHAGQNSISEAIQYEVPVVCLPLSADQPLVARRVCDELQMGVRFDTLTLESRQLSDAIVDVLSNPEFNRRVCELSKISSKYNGSANSAELILDYLNSDENIKKTN